MINKRIYGAPLSGVAREKLHSRQKTPQSPKPGDPISPDKPFNPNEGVPFVRMWTSVKLMQPSTMGEVLKADLGNGQGSISPQQLEEQFDGDLDLFKKEINTEFGIDFTKPTNKIIPIYKDKKDENGMLIIDYYVVKTNIRDQVDFARKIYKVGDHNYLSNYGEVKGNESLQTIDGQIAVNPSTEEGHEFDTKTIDIDSEQLKTQVGANLFPDQSKDNPFLKPLAGITSVESETMGSLGLIKKTTINFVVHNFYDFDRIYSKYFLKPGATIFIDFGWSTIPTLYNPADLIDATDSQIYLYGEKKIDGLDGVVTEAKGDLEVLQGLVTNYESKVIPNGSVECSVEITSANNALLTLQAKDDYISRLKSILTHGVLFLGLTAIVDDLGDGAPDNDLKRLLQTPNPDSSPQEIDNYIKNLKLLAYKELSSRSSPMGNAVRTGIFLDNLDADNIYISWGRFEDMIINSQFGFGKDFQDVNKSDNFQVNMDSSNSLTIWHKDFAEQQHITQQVKEGGTTPTTLYPEWWHDMDDGMAVNQIQELGAAESRGGSIVVNFKNPEDIPMPDQWKTQNNGDQPFGGSYSFQKGKFPKQYYNDKRHHPESDYFAGLLDMGHDMPGYTSLYGERVSPELAPPHYLAAEKKDGAIPIREVFINVKTIIEAFETETDIRNIIQMLLRKINQSSGDLFNWTLKSGATDSQLEVVDLNFVDEELRKEIVDLTDSERDKRWFKFNIMSPNSIVKEYNFELNLPGDSIGNYYAIQAMSHDNSLFSIDPEVNKALTSIISVDNDSRSIIYEPDHGGYRLEQTLNRQNDSEAFDVFETLKPMLETRNLSTLIVDNAILDNTQIPAAGNLMSSPALNTPTAELKNKFDWSGLLKANEDRYILKGYQLANSVSEYYNLKIHDNYLSSRQSILMPYTLSMKIYGLATIIPGDTFEIDYIPEIYKKSSYLQIMKVRHEVDSTGWSTVLETQFRTKPNARNTNNINVISSINSGGTANLAKTNEKIRLSPRALTKLRLRPNRRYRNTTFLDELEKRNVESLWKGKISYKADEFVVNNVTIQDIAPFMEDCIVTTNIFNAGLTRGTFNMQSRNSPGPGCIIDFKTSKDLSQMPNRLINQSSVYIDFTQKVLLTSVHEGRTIYKYGYGGLPVDKFTRLLYQEIPGDWYRLGYNSLQLSADATAAMGEGYVLTTEDKIAAGYHGGSDPTGMFFNKQGRAVAGRDEVFMFTKMMAIIEQPDRRSIQTEEKEGGYVTRLYPPMVYMMPNSRYKMFIVDGGFCILKTGTKEELRPGSGTFNFLGYLDFLKLFSKYDRRVNYSNLKVDLNSYNGDMVVDLDMHSPATAVEIENYEAGYQEAGTYTGP